MPDAEGNPYPVNKKSLILYLETRAVDHIGTIDTRHINDEEFEQLEEWKKTGLLTVFERIYSKKIINIQETTPYPPTYICKLSRRAIRQAQRERKARIKRTWKKESHKWRKPQ